MKKHFLAIITLSCIVFSISSCKKDPFSEKDAIAAQQQLLQLKYSYELQISGINLQIQRVSDSAKIAIQLLINKGMTDLELLQAKNKLAQSLQDLQNQMALYKYQDSLSRASSVFKDSLTQFGPTMRKNYNIIVNDFVTNTPIAGATVRVLPYNSPTIVSATTDANGVAQFVGIVVDPNALFYVTRTGFATTMVKRSNIDANANVSLWNTGNTNDVVSGRMVADLDLTNVNDVEGLAGQLVTFTNTDVYNGQQQTIQFSTVTDANGNYSIGLPDIKTSSFWNVVTPDRIKASQKVYLNYFTDENPLTVLPRIDSVGVTFQKATTATGSHVRYGVNSTFINTSLRAYYLRLPKDSLGNQVILTTVNGGFISFPLVQGNDSLAGIVNLQNGFFSINNGNVGNSVLDPSHQYPKKRDTLDVSFVPMARDWMVVSPVLKAYINEDGKIFKIDYPRNANQTIRYNGSGVNGKFKNTFTQSLDFGAPSTFAIQNLSGVRNWPANTSANMISINSTIISSADLNGGRRVTLNFDYLSAQVYDRIAK